MEYIGTTFWHATFAAAYAEAETIVNKAGYSDFYPHLILDNRCDFLESYYVYKGGRRPAAKTPCPAPIAPAIEPAGTFDPPENIEFRPEGIRIAGKTYKMWYAYTGGEMLDPPRDISMCVILYAKKQKLPPCDGLIVLDPSEYNEGNTGSQKIIVPPTSPLYAAALIGKAAKRAQCRAERQP